MPRTNNSNIKPYQKKDGKTYYMFKIYLGSDSLTGKPKFTTRRGFKTIKEAELEYSRLKLETSKHPNILYREIYKLWVEQYKSTVEESTFRKTTRYFKHHILPALGDYPLDKINVDVCQVFVNDIANTQKKARVIKNYASKVLDFALKREMIKKNPFQLVEMPKKKASPGAPKPAERNFYTKEELMHFLSILEKENNLKVLALFRLLAFSGMRTGELLALTWEDIDFKNQKVQIFKAVSRGLKNQLYLKSTKNGTPRTIMLDDKTIEILKEWNETQKDLLGEDYKGDEQLIFPNEQKNEFLQPSRLGRWLNEIIEKYDLPKITPHGFRHTHTSLLIEAGVNMKSVQQRLGHSTIKTTMDVYTHISNFSENHAVNILVDFLNEEFASVQENQK